MSHRGKARSSSARGQAAPAAITPEGLLQEAEMLQQRAERRSGQDALQALEAAAAKYREAMAAGLHAEARSDAAFGLGECLQLWADGDVQLAEQASDEVLAQGLQQQVAAKAAGLYQASLQAYQQVVDTAASQAGPPPMLRTDAAVNAANALSSWAELVGGQQAEQLLSQAVQLYRSALSQEEDALTLSNLGDALVAQGEAALLSGQPDASQAAFAAALESYQAACSLSDSSAGDDLPGLLHNWGVGLHTIAKHAQACELKQQLLQQAADKLRASIQFSRGDPAPHNALGDVLMDAAELMAALSSARSGGSSSGLGGSSPLPSAVAEQTTGLIKQAADEGYMAALTINRTNADALVGIAEAAVAMAKVARRQGDEAAAATHFAAAVGHYSSALQRPHLLGGASDRTDVRYNAACAAALAGQMEMAKQLLAALAASGDLTIQEAAADEDLATLPCQLWSDLSSMSGSCTAINTT